MKKARLLKVRGSLISTFAALLCAFAFTGCVESDPPMIAVSKNSIQAGCEAQSISVTVTSNARWTASSDASWITLSRTEGTNTEELDLILEACDATQSRMGVITLKTEGRNVTQTTITVAQNAKNTVLQLAPAEVTAGAAAQNVAFAIASNGDWTVTSTSSWATPKVTTGSGNAIVTVALAENSSHSADREAKIVIAAGNDVERAQAEFTITQLSRELPALFLTHNTLSFAADAKTKGTNVATVPIITNVTGDVKVTSEFSWCDAVFSNGVVTVTVQDNSSNDPRTCIVTVYANVNGEMVMKQILVSQAGLGAPTLTMVNTNIVVPSFSGNTGSAAQDASVFYLPSSDGIAVSVLNDYPEWITNVAVDKTNHIVSFKIAANESSSPREATLSVIAKLGDQTMSYPINVTQQGVGQLKVVLSKSSMAVPAAGGTVTFDAFVNTPQATISAYSANASWATVKTNTTSNSFGISSTVAVTVAANSNADSRSADILVPVKVGDQMVYGSVSVIQAGVDAPNASVTEGNISLPQVGGDYTVNVYGADANTTIKAIVPVSWVKAVVTNSAVKFTLEPNASSSARSTVVNLVVTRGGKTQIIPISIKQAGTGSPELLIAEMYYEFAQVGATYEIPIVSENGTQYEVISTPDWIATESMASPAGIKAVVASNPDADPRTGDIVILAENGGDYTYYIISTKQKGLEAPDIEIGQELIVIPRTATVGTEGYAVTVSGADASTSVVATSDQPWVKGIVSTDKTSIAIAAEENKASAKRTATISVVAERGGQQQILTFSVVQPGTGSAELRIAVLEYTFGPKAVSEFDIPVTALHGTTYTVASKPDFVTVSGEGTAMLKIALSSNESTTESREGVIVLRAVNGSDEVQYSIDITQLGMNGPNVEATIYSIVVPRTAINGDEGYDVALIGADAATSLKTASTATWISGVITAGGYLSFKTQENTASDARTAVVSVIATRAGEEQVLSIQVTQPGTGSAELEIALPDYTFTYEKVDSFPVPVTMLHGTQYTVAAKPEWLKVEGEGTNKLYFSLTKNTVVEMRSGTVILRATNGTDEVEYTIGVTQLGIDGPNLRPEYYFINVPRVATADRFLEVLGYDGDTKVTFNSNATWFTAGWNDRKDRVYFNVQENTFSAKRQGTLTVQAEKGGQQQQFVITVIQPGTGSAELEIPHMVYYFTYAKTENFDIPVNPLNGSKWTVSSQDGSAWLTWTGEGTENFKVSLAENDNVNQRSETLVFRATNGDDETLYDVDIIQMGIDGPNVTAVHESVTIPYQLLQPWMLAIDGVDDHTTIDLEENCLWARVSYNKQSNPHVIYLNADDNNGNDSRSFTLSVLATKGGQTQIVYIDVTQLGVGSPYLILPTQELVFGPEEVTYDYYFVAPIPAVADVTARAQGTYNFLTLGHPENHTGNEYVAFYSMRIELPENQTTQARTEEIVLTATSGDQSIMYTVKVTQLGNKAPKVYVVNPNRTVPATVVGGNDVVTVLNNGATPGTASASEDWITSCQATENSIEYTYSANTKNTPRMAVVSAVYTLNGESKLMQVFVTQLANGGATLTLSGNEFTFGHAAFTAFPVGVIKGASTINYAASSTADWISNITQTADGFTFDLAENTKPNQRQGYITVIATNGVEQSVYTIGVTQMGTEGPNVTLLENKLDLPSKAVTTKDNKVDLAGVDAATEITVTDDADWLTATYENGYVYVNTLTNTLDQPRTAIVSIVAKKGGQMQYFNVTVIQAAAKDYSFAINPNTLYFDKNGGPRVIAASYTNVDYLEIDGAVPAWITFANPGVREDGVYNLDIAVSAQTGLTDPAREGTITIKYGASATDYRTMTITVSQASSTGYYLEPGGGIVLLPAYITTPGGVSGRSKAAAVAERMTVRHIAITGATSLTDMTSNVVWASASSSANIAIITDLENNTLGKRRYGFVDFKAQTDNTPLQIQVVQLAGTEPQIVGAMVTGSDNFLKTMSVDLLNQTNTVTFNTSNVTSMTATPTDEFEGYNTLAKDKYSLAAAYGDNAITLTVEPKSQAAKTTIAKGSIGIVKLDVTDGTATNTYYVKVVVPQDIIVGPFDTPVFTSPSPVDITDQTSYAVQWTGVAGVESYNLQYKGTGDNAPTEKTVNGTSYDLVVRPGIQYVIQVKANASLPCRTESAYSTSLTLNDHVATPVVSWVNTSTDENHPSLLISCNPCAGATVYYLYNNGGPLAQHGASSSSPSLAVGGSFANELSLTMFATGTADACISAQTEPLMIKYSVLSAPTGLSAAATSNNDANKITFSWNSVANADSYGIAISTDGTNFTEYTATSTSYELSGAVAGTTYTYKVRAIADYLNKPVPYFSSVYSSINTFPEVIPD
jgi:hypothetical protein